MFDYPLRPCTIRHFGVPPGLCIKTRLSAQPLIWKWIFILIQIKLIFTRKVAHLASFWKWGFLELGSDLFVTLLFLAEFFRCLFVFVFAFCICIHIRVEGKMGKKFPWVKRGGLKWLNKHIKLKRSQNKNVITWWLAMVSYVKNNI